MKTGVTFSAFELFHIGHGEDTWGGGTPKWLFNCWATTDPTLDRPEKKFRCRLW